MSPMRTARSKLFWPEGPNTTLFVASSLAPDLVAPWSCADRDASERAGSAPSSIVDVTTMLRSSLDRADDAADGFLSVGTGVEQQIERNARILTEGLAERRSEHFGALYILRDDDVDWSSSEVGALARRGVAWWVERQAEEFEAARRASTMDALADFAGEEMSQRAESVELLLAVMSADTTTVVRSGRLLLVSSLLCGQPDLLMEKIADLLQAE
jgi:hypothetical protein